MFFSPTIERKIMRSKKRKKYNPSSQVCNYSLDYNAPIHSTEDFDEFEALLGSMNVLKIDGMSSDKKLFLNAHISNSVVCMGVDTGAGMCTMSSAIMDHLGLRDQMEETFDIVDTSDTLGEINGVEVSLDGFKLQLSFVITDTSDQFIVLGVDQLRKYGCVIDVPGNFMTFGSHRGKKFYFMKENEIKTVQSHLDLKKLDFNCGRCCA